MNENKQPGRDQPSPMSGAANSGGADEGRSPGSHDAAQELHEAADDVTRHVRQAAEHASEAASKAREKAEALADHGKQMGVGQMHGIARAARGAADELQDQSPEMARAVRQAADGLDKAANSIRGKSVGEIVDMFDGFARRQPAAYFGGAVLAGFVLTRFMKSRADRPVRSAEPRQPDSARPDDRGANETAPFPSPMNMPTMPSTVGEVAS
jgi:ABC-type transporter Mla subunit MlaD